jgi:hypothetical protein
LAFGVSNLAAEALLLAAVAFFFDDVNHQLVLALFALLRFS